ncbi:MAG: hypothetical protein ACOYBQ_02900 [Fluviibacter sp.]
MRDFDAPYLMAKCSTFAISFGNKLRDIRFDSPTPRGLLIFLFGFMMFNQVEAT